MCAKFQLRQIFWSPNFNSYANPVQTQFFFVPYAELLGISFSLSHPGTLAVPYNPVSTVVLYRLICWRLGDEQLLSVRKHFLQSLNIDWRFGDLLSFKQKRQSLVAFTGLEGVNSVFSHVSLILVATSSIFAKSILTSFLLLVLRTCAPMFLEQNARVSHFFSQKSSS